ncbi:endospore germination permease [Paenibacillus hodogayensis]|uniref:Endospore germination permease n=1 Tax=Paenibacillus hodogayensis TaxID=279208 RepID=A0ABV5W1H9_9BACL
MPKERISGYQLVMLSSVLYIAGMMCSMFKTLAEVSMQDAWLNFFLAMLYAWLIAYLLYLLARAYPGKNMFEICEFACGKWLGRFINVIVLLYVMHLLVRDLRIFGDFVGTAVLQRTPTEYIYLAAMIVLIYFATGNVEEFTRSVNLLYPIFFINLLLLPLLLLNEMDMSYIQPILATGAGTVMKGGALSAGWGADIFVFGAFMSYMGNSRQFYVSLKFGIIVSTVVLTILMILCLSVLGPALTCRAIYPVYTLTQQINITDFLDRLDVLLIGFWIPAFLFRMIMLYFCFLAGLSSMLGTGNLRGINVMSGWFALLLTLVSFKSVMEVFRFGNYASFPLALVVQLLFFVPVLIGLFVKSFKKPPRKKRAEGSRRLRMAIWVLLAVAMTALFAGGYSGHLYKGYGIAGGAVYGAALLAIAVVGAIEFWRMNRIVRHPSEP